MLRPQPSNVRFPRAERRRSVIVVLQSAVGEADREREFDWGLIAARERSTRPRATASGRPGCGLAAGDIERS